MKKFQQELLAEESDNSKQKKFDPPKDENICPGFFFFCLVEFIPVVVVSKKIICMQLIQNHWSN